MNLFASRFKLAYKLIGGGRLSRAARPRKRNDTNATIFTDLLGHWANLYVASAQIKGIVNGQDNFTFGVGQSITRQDAAVMLKRVLDYKGISLESGEVKTFSDADEIAEYAKESVDALASAGVINGMTETEFAPAGKLTRAQAAKLIYGALSRYERRN